MEANKNKSILLIFDNNKESEFITSNLMENGITVYNTDNIVDGLKKAKSVNPQMIVVDTENNKSEMEMFNEEVKDSIDKNILSLNIVNVKSNKKNSGENKKISSTQHYISQPVRPKLLLTIIRNIMYGEDLKWFPDLQ